MITGLLRMVYLGAAGPAAQPAPVVEPAVALATPAVALATRAVLQHAYAAVVPSPSQPVEAEVTRGVLLRAYERAASQTLAAAQHSLLASYVKVAAQLPSE